MSDLISRQAAIDLIDDLYVGETPFAVTYDEVNSAFKGVIRMLPSAQPERKKGTVAYTHFSEELWGQSAICDLCGCKWQIAEEGEDNYCPNCGAEMEVEE